MLECPPQCPTVRRQLRDRVKRAGWTDEYIQSIVGFHSVDAENVKRRLGQKVKPDPRQKLLGYRKRGRQEPAIDYDYQYKEQGRDHFESRTRDLERVIDYEELIDDSNEREDKFERPVASLTQESIYYTKKKQIARVTPLRRVTPKVSPQSSRDAPNKSSRIRTSRAQSRENGSPIKDGKIIVYERGEVADTALVSRKELNHTVPVHEIPYRKIDDREIADYGRTSHDEHLYDHGTPDRKVLDHKIIDHESPGPSRIMDDERLIKSRDDSPDSYYKYTPKELPNDWPHDGYDKTCPTKILEERAEKLQEKSMQVSQGYLEDVCTCSFSCMMHHFRKDPFIRSILTSAVLFVLGLKLCSELHGWYLPIRG